MLSDVRPEVIEIIDTGDADVMDRIRTLKVDDTLSTLFKVNGER